MHARVRLVHAMHLHAVHLHGTSVRPHCVRSSSACPCRARATLHAHAMQNVFHVAVRSDMPTAAVVTEPVNSCVPMFLVVLLLIRYNMPNASLVLNWFNSKIPISSHCMYIAR
jgi:hypothetical protein